MPARKATFQPDRKTHDQPNMREFTHRKWAILRLLAQSTFSY